jgi:hypothetical protein
MAALPDYVVGRIIVTDYLGGKSSDAGAKGKNFVRRVGSPGDDLQSAGFDEHQLVAAPPGFGSQSRRQLRCARSSQSTTTTMASSTW